MCMQTIFFLTDDTALSTDDPLHLRKNIFKILDDKIKANKSRSLPI